MNKAKNESMGRSKSNKRIAQEGETAEDLKGQARKNVVENIFKIKKKARVVFYSACKDNDDLNDRIGKQ